MILYLSWTLQHKVPCGVSHADGPAVEAQWNAGACHANQGLWLEPSRSSHARLDLPTGLENAHVVVSVFVPRTALCDWWDGTDPAV